MANDITRKMDEVKHLKADEVIELNAHVVDMTKSINDTADEIDVLTRNMNNLADAKARYDVKVKKLRNTYANVASKL